MQKSYYAIIPANVRYDNDLNPNAKLLYGEITALCNEKGFCWAGNSYFSTLYQKDKSTIARWIKQLEEKGYITREVIYKEGTKEIDQRYMRICGEGIGKNATTPIGKSERDNTTVINTTNNIPYVEVVDYLNEKTNSSYRHKAKKTREVIQARWNEGNRLEDFKKVIDYFSTKWSGTTFNNGASGDTYLRPSTLFNNKFDERLNEASKNRKALKKDSITQYNSDSVEAGELLEIDL